MKGLRRTLAFAPADRRGGLLLLASLLGLAALVGLLQLRFEALPGGNAPRATDGLAGLLLVALAGLVWGAGLSRAGLLSALGLADGLLAAAGLAAFAAGAWVAGAWQLKMPALALCALGGLALTALAARRGAERGPAAPAWPLWAFAAACAAVAALVVLGNQAFIKLFFDPAERGNVMWMFPRRATQFSEPIPGGPLQDYSRLAVPALGLSLGLGAAWLAARLRPASAATQLWTLAAAALGLKLAVAHLSPLGVDLLWLKARTIHSSYLGVTLDYMQRMGPWSFLARFHEFQGSLPVHAGTHGPLPELFYWPLAWIFGERPAPIALVYMALVNLAAFPLYRLTRALSGRPGLGLAAAALWLFSPQNLILGNAGFDAALFGLLALSFWWFLRALQEGRAAWALAAGAVFWLCQLASMASLVFPVAFGLFAWAWAWRRQGSAAAALRAVARPYLLWLLSPLAGHLLLWALTLGGFSYLRCCQLNYGKYMADMLSFHQDRPSFYWSWGNWLVFTGYASVPLMTAYLATLARRWSRLELAEGFTLPASVLPLALFFTVFGLAEVHRDYIWASFFLIPAAAGFFAGEEGRGAWEGARTRLLALAAVLAVVNAVVLEIWVFDQN